MAADYEFSSAYVEAIIRALKRHPKAKEVEAALTSEARALFDNPWSDQWQPAELMERVGDAAVAVCGDQAFEELTWLAMKEKFGPILLPMIKSTLATKSPGNVLKKLNDLVRVALRGIEVSFKPEGTNAGWVLVTYPRPVAKHVVASWLGVIRFVFDITVPGEVTQQLQSPDGTKLKLMVTWPETPP